MNEKVLREAGPMRENIIIPHELSWLTVTMQYVWHGMTLTIQVSTPGQDDIQRHEGMSAACDDALQMLGTCTTSSMYRV